MAFDEGILHFWPFAKYAVAFPSMSRSIFTRASSARRRLISICSAVTPSLAADFLQPSLAMRLDPIRQRLLHHAKTARRLGNALARLHQTHRLLLELQRVPASFPVPHLRRLPSLLQQLAKGYVLRGQGHTFSNS